MRLRGECLCRRTAFEVDDAFEYAFFCHCSNCRRATGTACKPLAGIRAERVSFVRGQDALLRFGDGPNHDLRCGTCGSLLFCVVRDGAYVHAPLGVLVDPPTIRPSAHIFVGSKAPWDLICDGLPEYDEFPPG